MSTTTQQQKTYSNPSTSRTVDNWPYGRDLRTTAMFYVETHPKRGQRAVRRTVNPANGTLSAPKVLTYANRMRIVDGSDGKTYILADQGWAVSVFQSNMQFQEENIPESDARFAETKALFDVAEQEVSTT